MSFVCRAVLVSALSVGAVVSVAVVLLVIVGVRFGFFSSPKVTRAAMGWHALLPAPLLRVPGGLSRFLAAMPAAIA